MPTLQGFWVASSRKAPLLFGTKKIPRPSGNITCAVRTTPLCLFNSVVTILDFRVQYDIQESIYFQYEHWQPRMFRRRGAPGEIARKSKTPTKLRTKPFEFRRRLFARRDLPPLLPRREEAERALAGFVCVWHRHTLPRCSTEILILQRSHII